MSFGITNPMFLYFFSFRNINLKIFVKTQTDFHFKLEAILSPNFLQLFAVYAGKAISKQQINFEGNEESFTFTQGTKMPV
jgi:hypothetical protein